MNIITDSFSVRESRPEDIAALKDRLRSEDLREVLGSGFAGSKEALERGLNVSFETYTVCVDNVPAAMFGIISKTLLGAEAVIWFLGAPEMSRIKKSFMRWSRIIVSVWLGRYPILYNIVPCDYKKSIAWLKWLGAKSGEPIRLNGVDFQPMVLTREG